MQYVLCIQSGKILYRTEFFSQAPGVDCGTHDKYEVWISSKIYMCSGIICCDTMQSYEQSFFYLFQNILEWCGVCKTGGGVFADFEEGFSGRLLNSWSYRNQSPCDLVIKVFLENWRLVSWTQCSSHCFRLLRSCWCQGGPTPTQSPQLTSETKEWAWCIGMIADGCGKR